jgi:hypothetical protein
VLVPFAVVVATQPPDIERAIGVVAVVMCLPFPAAHLAGLTDELARLEREGDGSVGVMLKVVSEGTAS